MPNKTHKLGIKNVYQDLIPHLLNYVRTYVPLPTEGNRDDREMQTSRRHHSFGWPANGRIIVRLIEHCTWRRRELNSESLGAIKTRTFWRYIWPAISISFSCSPEWPQIDSEWTGNCLGTLSDPPRTSPFVLDRIPYIEMPWYLITRPHLSRNEFLTETAPEREFRFDESSASTDQRQRRCLVSEWWVGRCWTEGTSWTAASSAIEFRGYSNGDYAGESFRFEWKLLWHCSVLNTRATDVGARLPGQCRSRNQRRNCGGAWHREAVSLISWYHFSRTILTVHFPVLIGSIGAIVGCSGGFSWSMNWVVLDWVVDGWLAKVEVGRIPGNDRKLTKG